MCILLYSDKKRRGHIVSRPPCMVGNLDTYYVAMSISSQEKNNDNNNKKKQTNKEKTPAVTASLLSQSKDIDSRTLCQVCVQLLQKVRAKQRQPHSTDSQIKNQMCLTFCKGQLSGCSNYFPVYKNNNATK